MLKAKEEQIDTFVYMSISCITRQYKRNHYKHQTKNICNPFHLVRVNKQDNRNYDSNDGQRMESYHFAKEAVHVSNLSNQ